MKGAKKIEYPFLEPGAVADVEYIPTYFFALLRGNFLSGFSYRARHHCSDHWPLATVMQYNLSIFTIYSVQFVPDSVKPSSFCSVHWLT